MAFKRVFVGGFQAELEEALERWVRSCKASDDTRWEPLWIITPSASLQLFVKRKLAHRLSPAVRLGLQVMSLPQLYQILLEQLGDGRPDPGRTVRAFLIEQLLQDTQALSLRLFSALVDCYGVGSLILQAIEELETAGFHWQEMMEWLEDEALMGDPIVRHRLQDLVTVWRAYAEALERLGWRDTHLGMQAVLRMLETAAVDEVRQRLNLPRQVAFYGFFSFTGLGSGLVRALSRLTDVTLFYAVPLVHRGARPAFHPAFAYLQPAFEATFYAQAQALEWLPRQPDSHWRYRTVGLFASEAIPCTVQPNILHQPIRLHVWSCGQRLQEMEHVAGRVLHHIQRGTPPAEIAIVVRQWDETASALLDVLERYRVPYNLVQRASARDHPLVQWLETLIEGMRGEWRILDFFQVLRHPLFRLDRLTEADSDEVALWRLVAERYGIARGVTDWKLLWRLLDPDTPSRDPDGRLHGVRLTTDQFRRLRRAVRRFFRRFRPPRSQASWTFYAGWFERLVAQWTALERLDSDGQALWQAFQSQLRFLAQLDGLVEVSDLPFERFYRAVQHFLHHAMRPFKPPRPHGVWVLDALALRGLSFRWVLALGLEEGVFPRKIPDEPFLSDEIRRRLRVVNPWLSLPQEQFFEEQALFYLLVQAAREGLELSYTRTRETGQPLMRSQFIGELLRHLAPVGSFEEHRVLRNPQVRIGTWLRERAWTLIHPLDFTTWCQDQRRPRPPVGRVDMSSPYLEAWLRNRGLSPSLCAEYLRCPNRTLWKEHFRLDEPPFAHIQLQPDAAQEGELVHGFLREVFQRVRSEGLRDPAAIGDALARWFEAFEQTWGRARPVGLPGLWRWRRVYIRSVLERFIAHELEQLERDIEQLQVEYEVAVPWTLPTTGETVMVKGRMDRIQWGTPVEVVDYKWARRLRPWRLSGRWTPETFHRGSDDTGLQYLFQLAFYVWLLRQGPEETRAAARLAWLPSSGAFRSAMRWFHRHRERWTLGPPQAEALSSAVQAMVQHVAMGIRSGQFGTTPGPPCRRCAFDQICRFRDEV